jgi:hypothetical protein
VEKGSCRGAYRLEVEIWDVEGEVPERALGEKSSMAV